MGNLQIIKAKANFFIMNWGKNLSAYISQYYMSVDH